MVDIKFKEIPGYNGYFASSDGYIWSTIIRIGQGRGKSPLVGFGTVKKKMNPYKNKECRLSVNLGKGNLFFIHHLILITFVGPRPAGMEACHGDDDPTNNELINLRWGTSKENTDDQRKHGRLIGGEKHGMAKLSNDQVKIIKSLKGQLLQREIAFKFGITQSTVSVIHNNKSRTTNSHNGKGL